MTFDTLLLAIFPEKIGVESYLTPFFSDFFRVSKNFEHPLKGVQKTQVLPSSSFSGTKKIEF